MGHGLKEFARLDLQAEFFLELAAQADLVALVRFTLATGELPKSGQKISGTPLSDQQAAFAKDKPSRDFDDRLSGASWVRWKRRTILRGGDLHGPVESWASGYRPMLL
jgi:hypothetical protein